MKVCLLCHSELVESGNAGLMNELKAEVKVVFVGRAISFYGRSCDSRLYQTGAEQLLPAGGTASAETFLSFICCSCTCLVYWLGGCSHLLGERKW